ECRLPKKPKRSSNANKNAAWVSRSSLIRRSPAHDTIVVLKKLARLRNLSRRSGRVIGDTQPIEADRLRDGTDKRSLSGRQPILDAESSSWYIIEHGVRKN